MKLGKFIGMAMAALALSLAFCGCGDKKSKSESKSESQSDSESASSSNQNQGKFSPMVTKDAAFALGVNLDASQGFKIVDAYLDQVCGWLQLREEDVVQVKTIVSRSKKDLFACVPLKLRDLFDEKGLRDARLRWAVISLEDVEREDYHLLWHSLSAAIAVDVDLEKLIPKDLVIRWIEPFKGPSNYMSTNIYDRIERSQSGRSETNDVVFAEMSLEGEQVWHIYERRNDPIESRGKTIVSGDSGSFYSASFYELLRASVHEFEKGGIDLHVTSLDGQLLLAASSRGALAKLIRLYRQGKGAGDALRGFSAKEGELFHLKVEGVGERILNIGGRSGVREVAQFLPDGERIVMGLGAFEGDVKVSSDGTLRTSASLKAASEQDADKIRALAKVGLMKAQAQWSEEPYVPKEFVKMLDAVKIGGADGEIKVQNVDPLLAFGPVAASARLNAELRTMAMNGGKLIEGIKQANAWPRTWQEKEVSNARDDFSARAYRSATDYFNVLFDMEHYGTPEWKPIVDGNLLSTLGKNAVVGNRIEAKGLDWNIAANVTEEMQDSVCVLISANFNPAMMCGEPCDYKRRFCQYQIGPKSGAAKSMFGEKAIVYVVKGGWGNGRLEQDICYEHLPNSGWGRRSGESEWRPCKQLRPTEWLTPTGVVGSDKEKAKEDKGKGTTKKSFDKKESSSEGRLEKGK